VARAYDAVVTVELASRDPVSLHAASIGEAWLAVAGLILDEGGDSAYDGLPVREIAHVTLVVAHPDPEDEIIARLAEPERLAWMHANFTDRSRVAALGGAVAGDQADRRSLGGQRPGHREADAPAAPGDQRPASTQAQIHISRDPRDQLGAGSSPRSAALARRWASFRLTPRACGGRR
jgi:hypothetical protein